MPPARHFPLPTPGYIVAPAPVADRQFAASIKKINGLVAGFFEVVAADPKEATTSTKPTA